MARLGFFRKCWRVIPISFKILVAALVIPPAMIISTQIVLNKLFPADPLACDDEDCHCPSDPNCPGKLKRAAHAAKMISNKQ